MKGQRRRAAFAALAACIAALLPAGCVSTGSLVDQLYHRADCRPTAPDDRAALVRREAARARDWIAVESYGPGTVYDEPGGEPPRTLVREAARYAAVRSFPGHPVLDGRAYVYDQALAILWFLQAGDTDTARAVGRTLVALQSDDGAFGFGFDVRSGYLNAAYRRNGTVAWAAHALGVLGREAGDAAAARAALKATDHLAAAVFSAGVYAGLVGGGTGRWDIRYDPMYSAVFYPGQPFDAAVTEHALDAAAAFRTVGDHARADALGERILSVLYRPGEGRFAVAALRTRIDAGRALDAAGGWGALWLHGKGRADDARRSLDYTTAAFAVQVAPGVRGFAPYLDEIDGPLAPTGYKLVFVEGSLGVGLAAHRLGRPDTADDALVLAAALSCVGGPGVPYATAEWRDFTTRPAAAPTLWFLMLEDERRTGRTAPLFAPGGV